MSTEEFTTDFLSYHIEGYARAAVERNVDAHFSVPLTSQITDNLWVGGCQHAVKLPDHFRYVISLYPWEKYIVGDNVQRVEVTMYDAAEIPDPTLLYGLAGLVNQLRQNGPTLVHCQAGLNRSNLIAALALIEDGTEPEAAISLLREKRSPLVLCNKTFEKWLLEKGVKSSNSSSNSD